MFRILLRSRIRAQEFRAWSHMHSVRGQLATCGYHVRYTSHPAGILTSCWGLEGSFVHSHPKERETQFMCRPCQVVVLLTRSRAMPD